MGRGLCLQRFYWAEELAGLCRGGSCPFPVHHHTCEAAATGQIFSVQQCSHLEFNKHFCCHTLNHLSSFLLYAQSNIYSQMLYTTKCCLGALQISYSGSKDVWMQLADEVTNIVNSQAVPAATGNKCQGWAPIPGAPVSGLLQLPCLSGASQGCREMKSIRAAVLDLNL